MSDKPVALLVTSLIGAPLLIVCCGGGIAALAGIVGGFAGLFSGFGLIGALSIALVALTVTSVIRHRRKMVIENDIAASDSNHIVDGK
jgi:hypothetical protein